MIKKTAIAAALLLASGTASAAPGDATGEFCMFDGTGAVVNGGWATTCDESITATLAIGAVPSNEIAGTQLFFGGAWDAHDIVVYSEGTYNVDTIEGGTYTFTVNAGQLGVSMLFDWGATSNIDVVNIYDIGDLASGEFTLTSTDWDGDGILGGAMIDGPFVGFSANFNLSTSLSDFTFDFTTPVITVTNPSIVTVEADAGATYSDEGATATDTYILGGTPHSINVTPGGDTIDPSALSGGGTVTYTATDLGGNTATATRTVTVVDTTNPVITLDPADLAVSSPAGGGYTLPTPTVTDFESLTATVTGSVNNIAADTYTIYYNAVDSSGNTADTVTLVVTITNGDSPIIILNGASSIDINQGGTYTELGATATDTEDDPITPTVIITGSVDTNTVGTYQVFYNTTDLSGNPGTQVIRTVNILDVTAPTISLVGNAVIDVEAGSTYTDAGASASDLVDGSLSITTVNPVNTNAAVGTLFTITYNASDAAGNAATEVTRMVTIVDTTAPTITLRGNDPETLNQGDTYTDAGVLAVDSVDGALTPVVNNPVDTATAGTYTITYTATDNTGNEGTLTRTVIVGDTTPPVITLNGEASVTINVGDEFTPEGATATDNFDSALVAVTEDCSGVDNLTAGNYTCTYTVADADNNTSTLTRNVFVLDNTIVIAAKEPVLTANQTSDTRVITLGGGNVTVSTNLATPGNTFNWSATDNNLVPTDAAFDGATFTFAPDGLTAGTYRVSVTVNAATANTATATLLLQVIADADAPTLATDVDSDGDGTFDSAEGLGDTDNDGIPDYLDSSTLAATQVTLAAGTMSSSKGTLKLGRTAFAAGDLATGTFTPLVDIAAIAAFGSPTGSSTTNSTDSAVDSACIGGCFDFEVADIGSGEVIQVVLPLSTAIPENAVYRLYTVDAGWANFAVANNDAIASSAKINGSCPAFNATGAWIDGLFAGDECIRLTMQDGGSNDADRLANGIVKDPSGVASVTPVNTVNTADNAFTSGCSMSETPVNPLSRSDWWLLAMFIGWMGWMTMKRKGQID